MKNLALFFLVVFPAWLRADLTIVQKMDGASVPGQAGSSQVTIMMKGPQTRIDTGAMMSAIIDTKSGEITTLLHQQKQVMRISGEQAKAMAEMANKFQGKDNQQSKLVATGKKELIDGMETEVYTSDTAQGKATYWIAKNYPNAQEILKQMQAMQPNQWNLSNGGMPDFRDFPGMPVKTVVDFGGKPITSTLVSAKQDTIPESAFAIPTGYSEMKLPQILSGKKKTALPEPSVAASPTP